MKQFCPDTHTDCGVALTLKIIGSKWTMMILHNLLENKKRFGELQKSLPGISPKTLSQRLDELEKEGVVQRKVFAEIPLHVEYTLTQRGLSLKNIVSQIEDWGQKS